MAKRKIKRTEKQKLEFAPSDFSDDIPYPHKIPNFLFWKSGIAERRQAALN